MAEEQGEGRRAPVAAEVALEEAALVQRAAWGAKSSLLEEVEALSLAEGAWGAIRSSAEVEEAASRSEGQEEGWGELGASPF